MAAARRGGSTVVLVSSDGEDFELSHGARWLSVTISQCLQRARRGAESTSISLPNVAGRTLAAKVVEYCNGHAAAAATTTTGPSSSSTAASADQLSLERFDAEFIGSVDQAMLYDLLAVADVGALDIKRLFHLCCKRVGDMIRGRTPEQIRQAFCIDNDFTAEEEAQIRKSNGWLFNNNQ